jgi:mannose-1-phosphate guanylyltransferase/mannose-1-phosphate guanylyltransferase/mannose-6-phosphate isomerase
MRYEGQSAFLLPTGEHQEAAAEALDPRQQSSAAVQTIVPVVLSGGDGSRLWPFSTSDTPKQFLPLIHNRSLFSQALDRVRGREGFAAPIVVANARHGDLCARELEAEGADARLILEPCPRNTAPAVVMAAAVACETYGDDCLLLVMPSDHLIENLEEFHAAVRSGVPAARNGRLVTFGINPEGADTGYGYLRMGEAIEGAPGVKTVERFVEKPRIEVAESMVADGQHLWNAGIFLFRAGALLEEARDLAPEIADAACEAVAAAHHDGIRITPDLGTLSQCPSESIDRAVMEHSSKVAVVPMAPGWSDLGSWDALAAMIGTGPPEGPITMVDCESCYVRSDGLQVAALGVRDLIIVASGERLLILPRGRSQEVKKLLSVMDSLAA